jgi:proline dehydrogenase
MVTNMRLTKPVVDRFVAGDDLDDAIDAIKNLNAHHIGGILDLLGEGVVDPEGAEGAANDYLTAIKRIEETGIDTTVAVKPTQLGLALDKGAAMDHLRRLAAEAAAVGTTVEIDMEQSSYVSDTLDLYRTLHADFPKLRLAMQAYLRRTPVDLQLMAGLKPRIRLVKGAYAEPEALALQKRREVDAQYRFLVDWLFEQGEDPALGTHDHELLDNAMNAAARTGAGKRGFEIQMLYGIRRDLQQQLANQGYRVRVYVPYGTAWYPYLMRRMAEKPTNLLFFMRSLIGK